MARRIRPPRTARRGSRRGDRRDRRRIRDRCAVSHHIGEPAPQEPGDEDDSYPPPCSNPGGHSWASPRRTTAATANTVSPTATPDRPDGAHRLTFLLGLPKLADNALWRIARRLAAPVLISANALSRWTTDTLGLRCWAASMAITFASPSNSRSALNSAGFVAAARYNGFPWSVDDHLNLCAAASWRWFAPQDGYPNVKHLVSSDGSWWPRADWRLSGDTGRERTVEPGRRHAAACLRSQSSEPVPTHQDAAAEPRGGFQSRDNRLELRSQGYRIN